MHSLLSDDDLKHDTECLMSLILLFWLVHMLCLHVLAMLSATCKHYSDAQKKPFWRDWPCTYLANAGTRYHNFHYFIYFYTIIIITLIIIIIICRLWQGLWQSTWVGTVSLMLN